MSDQSRFHNLDPGSQEQRIQNLLNALARKSRELAMLAEFSQHNLRAAMGRFQERYLDFEILHRTLADYFDANPEERKRFALAENISALAFLALRQYVQMVWRYATTMDRQRNLPLGIRFRFEGMTAKLLTLESALDDFVVTDETRDEVRRHLQEALAALGRLQSRSSDLPEFH